ncbi:MAG: Fe-S cluster assembly ATPase SufC [Candidatus Eisenbacteria bacterium]|nr:Fe-S cluster assembly ATPase SufC [Candidatus Latescibacterota bacterium]MBD3302900.1 Fe-S cluster assembly ATPase SufC [Candidatus Eisenbacteria bacterium]
MSETKSLLACEGVRIGIAGKEVIRGVDLELRAGEKVALMGPNGSGKSTLVNTLMGHPGYELLGGKILLDGEEIQDLPADERARKGLFLGFQYPVSIPGVSVANVLRAAVNARRGKEVSVREFRKEMMAAFEMLNIDPKFAARGLNEGFSGGEKKRAEVLQMALLKPRVALMDETDSGLDIDALKTVAGGIMKLSGPETGVILVTHYQRLLNYIQPDRVHVLMEGRIVRSGGADLVDKLEEEGYDWLEKSVEERQEA